MFFGEILRLKCTLKEGTIDINASEMYFAFNTSWTIKEGLQVTSRSIEADINITKAFTQDTNVECRTNVTSLKSTYIHVDGMFLVYALCFL